MTSGQNEAAPHEAEQHEAQQYQPQQYETGQQVQPERRMSAADLHHLQFSRASMLRPGYVDAEVDRVMHRVAEEVGRLIAEKS